MEDKTIKIIWFICEDCLRDNYHAYLEEDSFDYNCDYCGRYYKKECRIMDRNNILKKREIPIKNLIK